MGREIKRVALDFNAPLDQPWAGYENALHKPCPADGVTCFGGDTAASKWLDAVSRLIAMLGEQAVSAPRAEAMHARGTIYPHPYLEEWGQAPRTEISDADMAAIRATGSNYAERAAALARHLARHPARLLPLTEEMAALVDGLTRGDTGRSPSRDAFDVYRKLVEVAGMPETWGRCPICKGKGIDPAVAEAYEKWERVEPPAGEGWQLWQTVSDGPISPVFATAAELVDWMAQPDTKGERGPFPDMPWAQGWRREVAEKFVNGPGWAPSFVIAGGKLMSGAEYAGGDQ